MCGAAPLEDYRLAICNPYDDHSDTYKKFCEREMIVTERSSIIEALRKHGFNEWIDEESPSKKNKIVDSINFDISIYF